MPLTKLSHMHWTREFTQYSLPTGRRKDSFVPRKTDLVVAVVGPTGAGKSTVDSQSAHHHSKGLISHDKFVNTLLGKEVASVGHGLQSQTTEVESFILSDEKFPNNRIVVIDTPGFDDTYIDDREILRRIAIWLAVSYKADMKLAGLLYLHKITANRWTGSQDRNLDLFQKLCGEEAMTKVVLVTTMWSNVIEKEGRQRHQELLIHFWNNMRHHGSAVIRFDGTQHSAQCIVAHVLEKHDFKPVQIQREMVEAGMSFRKTSAGRSASIPYTKRERAHHENDVVSSIVTSFVRMFRHWLP